MDYYTLFILCARKKKGELGVALFDPSHLIV